jgi:hypothetical protein
VGIVGVLCSGDPGWKKRPGLKMNPIGGLHMSVGKEGGKGKNIGSGNG